MMAGTQCAPVPPLPWRRSDRSRETSSAGDDEIDSLRPLALLVGLDVEADALTFVERFQAGALDRGDVNEDVATAVVRLDEAITALAIEELDRTGHCHRETPPRGCSAVGPHGSTARLDIHRREKLRPIPASDITAASPRRWNVKAPPETNIQPGTLKRPNACDSGLAGQPIHFSPSDCRPPEHRQQCGKQ